MFNEMKNIFSLTNLKKILPYGMAIIIFIIVSFAYCAPVLEGKKINWQDKIQSQAMSKESIDYRNLENDEPLWSTSMFSGMPTYQFAAKYPNNIGSWLRSVVTLKIPGPMYHIFLSMLVMFISLLLLRANLLVAFLGGLAFGLCTFHLISIEAGHTSKIAAVAFIPLILSGVYLCLTEKRYLGAIMVTIGVCLQLTFNHLQITYYTLLAVLIMVIFLIVIQIKRGNIKQLLLSGILLLTAALVGAGSNFGRLATTYEYGKETIRGGQSELVSKVETAGGLTKDYAFSWSYGITETGTLIIPNYRGGGSQVDVGKNSKAFKELRAKGVPANQATSYVQNLPTYWGDQPFTSGPIYLGAILWFLFVLSLFTLKKSSKWMFLSVIILSIIIAWGKYASVITGLFFDYLPLYNKFRAPSMALVLTESVAIIMAMIGLQKFMEIKDQIKKKDILKKVGLISLGGIAFLGLIGVGLQDFTGSVDAQIKQDWLLEILRSQRKSMLIGDTFRSLALAAVAFLILWFSKDKESKVKPALILLIAFLFIDAWFIGKRYFNNDNFVSKRQVDQIYAPSDIDLEILNNEFSIRPELQSIYDGYLQQTPKASNREKLELKFAAYRLNTNVRIFDSSIGNPFTNAMPSYFHKSIGGYHAAKLIRYQDLIENHLSKGNQKVYNMLNTKYYITKSSNGKPQLQLNPSALGNAWFVDSIIWVQDANTEIQKLNTFDPANEVVINNELKNEVVFTDLVKGEVKMIDFSPMEINYEYNGMGDGFIVFSEVYFNSGKGWQAYLDGEKVDHQRVNYTLRGMQAPQGNHKISFKFESKSYALSKIINLIASILFVLFIAGLLFLHIKRKESTNENMNKVIV
ncbi:MAG: hypothetical protein ACJAZ3_000160 [Sphingobacteriales bacterium]|jgi:hypothetical protein